MSAYRKGSREHALVEAATKLVEGSELWNRVVVHPDAQIVHSFDGQYSYVQAYICIDAPQDNEQGEEPQQ